MEISMFLVSTDFERCGAAIWDIRGHFMVGALGEAMWRGKTLPIRANKCS